MPPSPCSSKLQACLVFFGLTVLLAGCAFIPSHQVSVDAINGLTGPIGSAYRLADTDPMRVRDPNLHKRVFACVTAALETKGVYEATAGLKPDFTVEVEYGVQRGAGFGGAAGMVPMTEYYLQLSARRPKADDARGKGEEIWNVRVSVVEEQIDFGTILPVLAAVAADYAGLDTQTEKTIKVSEKAANIMHIKSVTMPGR